MQVTQVDPESSNTSLTARSDNERDIGTPEAIIRLLEDPTNRAILQATSEGALTVQDLVERCDIPQSTAYRKINDLTEVGLLSEQIRVSPEGRHKNEYEMSIEQLTVSFGSDENATAWPSQVMEV